MKQKTAMQELIDQLMPESEGRLKSDHELIKKALEKERQQIIDAYGVNGTKYYNETFESNDK